MSIDFYQIEEEVFSERVGFREGFKESVNVGEIVGLCEFGDEGDTERLSWVVVFAGRVEMEDG